MLRSLIAAFLELCSWPAPVASWSASLLQPTTAVSLFPVLAFSEILTSIQSKGTAVSTLLLIILGVVVLICGGFYEMRTKREALFPPAAFNNLTTGMNKKYTVTIELIPSLFSHHPLHNFSP